MKLSPPPKSRTLASEPSESSESSDTSDTSAISDSKNHTDLNDPKDLTYESPY